MEDLQISIDSRTSVLLKKETQFFRLLRCDASDPKHVTRLVLDLNQVTRRRLHQLDARLGDVDFHVRLTRLVHCEIQPRLFKFVSTSAPDS